MKFTLIKHQQLLKVSILLIVAVLFLFSQPAIAHHPLGGKTPSNFGEGFLSGLAHPIIGLDHFAFVVASGLLGARLKQGLLIPLAFIIATMVGTGIHLQEINLPFPEGIIAASVILFGILLALKHNFFYSSQLSTIVLATLGMAAGVFHGYAYGESIVGSEMTPLVAYLTGFALIQLFIALMAFLVGKVMLKKLVNTAPLILRMMGVGISALGFVFLSTTLRG